MCSISYFFFMFVLYDLNTPHFYPIYSPIIMLLYTSGWAFCFPSFINYPSKRTVRHVMMLFAFTRWYLVIWHHQTDSSRWKISTYLSSIHKSTLFAKITTDVIFANKWQSVRSCGALEKTGRWSVLTRGRVFHSNRHREGNFTHFFHLTFALKPKSTYRFLHVYILVYFLEFWI